MGEPTEFVTAGQNMHLTLWNRKNNSIFRVGISLPLNLARCRQGRERGDDALGACGCDKNGFVASCDGVRIVYLYRRFFFNNCCVWRSVCFLWSDANFFFFWVLVFFGTLCWLWICVRFFFRIQLCFEFLCTVFGGAGDGFFQSSVE
jgi:hypothetical protein